MGYVIQTRRSALSLAWDECFSCKENEKNEKRMKDLLRGARVVFRASIMKFSSRRLADYIRTFLQKACRTCSTIIFPHSTNQIIELWRCRCLQLNSLICVNGMTLNFIIPVLLSFVWDHLGLQTFFSLSENNIYPREATSF